MANHHYGFLLHIFKENPGHPVPWGQEETCTIPLWKEIPDSDAESSGWHAYLVVEEKFQRKKPKIILNGEETYIFGHFLLDENRTYKDSQELLDSIRGQFALIHLCKTGSLILSTDLGMFPVYIFKSENEYIFSSRMDWLMAFRSSWTLYWPEIVNALYLHITTGKNTFIKEIHVADYCTSYEINRSGKMIPRKYWSPDFKPADESLYNHYFEQTLQSLQDSFSRVLTASKHPALGLTSGYDSRLSLAVCLSLGQSNLETVSWPHPIDMPKAIKIAKAVRMKHRVIDMDIDTLYEKFREDNLIPIYSGGSAPGEWTTIRMYLESLQNYPFDSEITSLGGELLRSVYAPRVKEARKEGISFFEYIGSFLRMIQASCREKSKNPLSDALHHSYDYYLQNVAKDCPEDLNDLEKSEWLSFTARFSKRWGSGWPRFFTMTSFYPVHFPYLDRDLLENSFKISIQSNAKTKNGLALQLMDRLFDPLLRYRFKKPNPLTWKTFSHIYTLLPPAVYPYYHQKIMKGQLEDLSKNWIRFGTEICPCIRSFDLKTLDSNSLRRLNSFLTFCLHLKKMGIDFTGNEGDLPHRPYSPSFKELWHHVQTHDWRKRARCRWNQGKRTVYQIFE